jgi:hypothetical protein
LVGLIEPAKKYGLYGSFPAKLLATSFDISAAWYYNSYPNLRFDNLPLQ